MQVHDEARHVSQVFIATRIVDQPYVAVIGAHSETALELLQNARAAAIWIAALVLLLAVVIGGGYVYFFTAAIARVAAARRECRGQSIQRGPLGG